MEFWAKSGTILLSQTNKIIISCCKDLLVWSFKLLKYADINAKCIYFQLSKDGKNMAKDIRLDGEETNFFPFNALA